MTRTISAWIILGNGKNKGKVALQKRSIKDSFPFVCQGTWAGGIEANEDDQEALLRECKEELGIVFFKNFDFSKIKLIAKNNFEEAGKAWETYNYLATINEKLLKLAKIHTDALNKFIFVGKDDSIYPISSGKDPEVNIVLFDDQYKTLKSILNGN